MFGMELQSVQLPPEMLLLIAKNLDDEEDCLSIALSGAFDGFSSLYGATRQRHGLFISHKCFFLTPRSWNQFFTKHISPEAITSFNANSCYWLSGQQICDHTLKMKSLQELAVKDTKVSLGHLTTVLETCQDITKLDMSYDHLPGIENKNGEFETPAVLAAFKKLISLKISTCVKKSREYVNDPWFFIIKMLSWCRNCVDLTVEITYSGESRQYMYFEDWDMYKSDDSSDGPGLPELDEDILPLRLVAEMWFLKVVVPNLDWMIKSLRNFVLIKLGPSDKFDRVLIGSRLLVHLFDWLFFEEPQPKSLLCLWISDFYFPGELDVDVLQIAPPLKAFLVNDLFILREEEIYDQFQNVEQISGIRFSSALAHLNNLKSASGIYDESGDENMLRFLQAHPNLERLCVYYKHNYVRNAVWQLLQLKSLYCGCRIIDKGMIDEFVMNYPNIEALHLENIEDQDDRFAMNFANPDDRDCLSFISFPRLTKLSLQGFHLHDGLFLLSIIKESPKLERIHLSDNISSITSFVLNLDCFLEKALNLKDFRLELKSLNKKMDVNDALLILKSLKQFAPKIERISLEFMCKTYPTDEDYLMVDFLVDFILKMKHLSCLSLSLKQLNGTLIQKVHERIKKEVLPTRPSLWFHLDRKIPDVLNPSVPKVHYHEMIHTNYSHPPPKL